MSNTIITPSIVAKESILLLDNMLVAGNRVYRGYEDRVLRSGQRIQEGLDHLDPQACRLLVRWARPLLRRT